MGKIRFLFSIIALFFLLLGSMGAYGQTKELDIYNEWFCDDSNFDAERPYFIIKDEISFRNFWEKTNFEGIAPHLNFDKYMVFVWAPGRIGKDCSQVVFERLVYKKDALLVLVDFASGRPGYIRGKRPIKTAIFPKFNNNDIFVFKKKKKARQEIEWEPVYAIWNLDGARNRPFEYVLMDKQSKPVYQLATSSLVLASKPEESKNTANSKEPAVTKDNSSQVKPVAVVRPVEVKSPRQETASRPESNYLQRSSKQSKPVTGSKKQNNSAFKPIVTNAPISIGGGSEPKVEANSQPGSAPGMGEDPLFGSEFDIVF